MSACCCRCVVLHGSVGCVLRVGQQNKQLELLALADATQAVGALMALVTLLQGARLVSDCMSDSLAGS